MLIDVDSIRFFIAPARIKSIEKVGQDISLQLVTSPGQTYSVEKSPDLSPASWTDLLGFSILGDGQDARVTDTNAVTSATQGFYRVRQFE